MDDCILDTNIALKLVLPEPDSLKAMQVLADVQAAGGAPLLLDLGLIEAANVICVQLHRRILDLQAARDAWADLKQTPIARLEAFSVLDEAFDLSLQFGIAVYDACFVAAVQKLGCRGVTADLPLVKKLGTAFPSIVLLKDW